MPTTTLNIPILVLPTKLDGQAAFQVRPVFFSAPVGVHRRYSEALSLFKKQVKRRYTGYTFTRPGAEQLLWYKFGPEVKLSQYMLEFSIGSHFIKGRFSVASFEWQGLTYASLPNFDSFMFIVKHNEKGKADLKVETERVVRELLRSRKQIDGSEFDAEAYYAEKKEFVTTVQVEAKFLETNFSFEKSGMDGIMAAFRLQEQFDGGEEIEKVATDLGAHYPEELNRAWQQEPLVEQLYQLIFSNKWLGESDRVTQSHPATGRMGANNPLVLVGPEGVGKHTVIHEVVYRYMASVTKNTDDDWQRQYFWHLNPSRVIAGMSIVGHWEKRFEAILQYVQSPPRREYFPDKLLVDNPVALLRIGKSKGSDLCLATVLKPFLEKRKIQLVLLATPEEWKIVQEGDRSFADLFQVLRMPEPDVPTAIKIVLQNRSLLELQTASSITVPAITQLFSIQRNYLKNKALPGSVMRLLTQLTTKYSHTVIDAPQVREEFKSFSGMQEQIFEEQSPIEKDELRRMLQQELVGQSSAVDALSGVVHLIKARLTDRNRPLASFLFIGPTGVGKTHAAKLLSKTILGSDTKLMRFDMNEYIDGGALHRLIGDSQNPEGQLTGKVRYQPFGVLLLDEIEKAHPSIHDLLLQVLDDARLTDSLGRTVDFSNTIIVMTSNLGAREADSQIGYASKSKDASAVYRKAVEQAFRPELVNRIEQIVVFNPLEFKEIQKIAQLQIRELLQRDGFVRRTTIVNVSEEALDWVARRGFDAKMGGRALKRQIERDLTLLSAEQLIKSTSETPVILDILFENEQLVPQITPIDLAAPLTGPWLPEIPEEHTAVRFFNKLLHRLEKVEKEVASFERRQERQGRLYNVAGQDADWKHYDFKNKVASLKESLQFKALRLRERRLTMTPAVPLRLKRVYLNEFDETGKARKEALRDKHFQEEAMKTLREEYRHQSPEFDSFETEYLVSYFDLTFLESMLKGFLNQKTEKVVLRLSSAVTNAGVAEMEFLLNQYSLLLSAMDIAHDILTDLRSIEAEEHSLGTLLAGEAGLHLFYINNGTPVPIRLSLEKDGIQLPSPPLVIRIYDGKDTQVDLRTGYTNTFAMTPDEMKLLLFGGMYNQPPV
ncbi:MAG: AAA family ATPase [Saprospiraceae bacterium]|nr:AAA family ATPase [Saprospiraceae bacterium]MCF8248603.1 AAA family ATPase [Saprospiraceae bacterium]MCF8281041.1 AAA family ATPase [Bacteroidales bacterium]MCF8310336.1 AAA family ATPase [Saprospiraceae bacterium]MCF8442083.1 AAA family ATPase [Saprospiraceae bacterium]